MKMVVVRIFQLQILFLVVFFISLIIFKIPLTLILSFLNIFVPIAILNLVFPNIWIKELVWASILSLLQKIVYITMNLFVRLAKLIITMILTITWKSLI